MLEIKNMFFQFNTIKGIKIQFVNAIRGSERKGAKKVQNEYKFAKFERQKHIAWSPVSAVLYKYKYRCTHFVNIDSR